MSALDVLPPVLALLVSGSACVGAASAAYSKHATAATIDSAAPANVLSGTAPKLDKYLYSVTGATSERVILTRLESRVALLGGLLGDQLGATTAGEAVVVNSKFGLGPSASRTVVSARGENILAFHTPRSGAGASALTRTVTVPNATALSMLQRLWYASLATFEVSRGLVQYSIPAATAVTLVARLEADAGTSKATLTASSGAILIVGSVRAVVDELRSSRNGWLMLAAAAGVAAIAAGVALAGTLQRAHDVADDDAFIASVPAPAVAAPAPAAAVHAAAELPAEIPKPVAQRSGADAACGVCNDTHVKAKSACTHTYLCGDCADMVRFGAMEADMCKVCKQSLGTTVTDL